MCLLSSPINHLTTPQIHICTQRICFFSPAHSCFPPHVVISVTSVLLDKPLFYNFVKNGKTTLKHLYSGLWTTNIMTCIHCLNWPYCLCVRSKKLYPQPRGCVKHFLGEIIFKNNICLEAICFFCIIFLAECLSPWHHSSLCIVKQYPCIWKFTALTGSIWSNQKKILHGV